MRGKQFFNFLILQTCASIFKHSVGKAPPSFPQIGHPIGALALASVSVSCPLFTFMHIMKHEA